MGKMPAWSKIQEAFAENKGDAFNYLEDAPNNSPNN
jgi:hypothetical protein